MEQWKSRQKTRITIYVPWLFLYLILSRLTLFEVRLKWSFQKLQYLTYLLWLLNTNSNELITLRMKKFSEMFFSALINTHKEFQQSL